MVAAEAAAPAAGSAAGGTGAATGGGSGALAGAGGAQGLQGGGGSMDKPKGVLLAIAIVLLWLAGLAFFVALEGSKLLGEQATQTGGGFFKAIMSGLANIVQQQAGGTAGEGNLGPVTGGG